MGIRRDDSFPYEKTISPSSQTGPNSLVGDFREEKTELPPGISGRKGVGYLPSSPMYLLKLSRERSSASKRLAAEAMEIPDSGLDEAIRNDLLNGKISPERAKIDYGFMF